MAVQEGRDFILPTNSVQSALTIRCRVDSPNIREMRVSEPKVASGEIKAAVCEIFSAAYLSTSKSSPSSTPRTNSLASPLRSRACHILPFLQLNLRDGGEGSLQLARLWSLGLKSRLVEDVTSRTVAIRPVQLSGLKQVLTNIRSQLNIERNNCSRHALQDGAKGKESTFKRRSCNKQQNTLIISLFVMKFFVVVILRCSKS